MKEKATVAVLMRFVITRKDPTSAHVNLDMKETEIIAKVVSFVTCDQAVIFSFFVLDSRVKGRLIHLLSASSARSPESGLLSNWSKHKKGFRAAHRLVTGHISDFRCN